MKGKDYGEEDWKGGGKNEKLRLQKSRREN